MRGLSEAMGEPAVLEKRQRLHSLVVIESKGTRNKIEDLLKSQSKLSQDPNNSFFGIKGSMNESATKSITDYADMHIGNHLSEKEKVT